MVSPVDLDRDRRLSAARRSPWLVRGDSFDGLDLPRNESGHFYLDDTVSPETRQLCYDISYEALMTMPFAVVYLDRTMIDYRGAAAALMTEPSALCWLPASALTSDQVEDALCRSGQALEELKYRPDILAILSESEQSLIRRIWAMFESMDSVEALTLRR